MKNKSKLALAAAIAAVIVTSPALASPQGNQVTGSASNREEQAFGHYSSDFGSHNGAFRPYGRGDYR